MIALTFGQQLLLAALGGLVSMSVLLAMLDHQVDLDDDQEADR